MYCFHEIFQNNRQEKKSKFKNLFKNSTQSLIPKSSGNLPLISRVIQIMSKVDIRNKVTVSIKRVSADTPYVYRIVYAVCPYTYGR